MHTLVAIQADFENVERVRHELKDQFRLEEGIGLTYLPLRPLVRRSSWSSPSPRTWNWSVGDEALVVHHDIHLGIAVDLQREGLIVPVIHNADGQSLRGIARSIADMARRGEKKLSADDITGGTFTITNPGPSVRQGAGSPSSSRRPPVDCLGALSGTDPESSRCRGRGRGAECRHTCPPRSSGAE